jgi:predicted Zn finger-like uncharacterized protein
MSDVAICPQCHAKYRMPDSPGKKLRCKKCGTVFVASAPSKKSDSAAEKTVLSSGKAAKSDGDGFAPTILGPQATPTQVDPTKRRGSAGVPTLTPDIEAIWTASISEGMTSKMTVKPPSHALSRHSRVSVRPHRVSQPEEGGQEAHYELLEVLGEGGMGVVYTARQTSVDRIIAIKMIKPKVATNADARDKFLAEAAITGDLDHPNIVPIHDLGASEAGALFYAMKLVKGEPWSKSLRDKPQRENLGILQRVSDAVAFAHSRSVIHRDLKPENVMLGEYGEVLLMDWGLAVSTDAEGKAENLSNQGACGGTPAYMAPEMAMGLADQIGRWSDIYLLGAILYEIVACRPPHRGKGVLACLRAAAENEIRSTEEKSELLDIALKAMATQPEDRHASVKDFQSALRDYQAHSESIALAARAQESLALAAESQDYRDFSRAMYTFEEAVNLWAENEAAAEGVRNARVAYATCAHGKGDLDLAASLLQTPELNKTPLAKKIRVAQAERAARQKRIKRLTYASASLAAAVLLVVTVAFFLVSAEKKRAENELAQRQTLEKERDEKRRQQRKEAENALTAAKAAVEKLRPEMRNEERNTILLEAENLLSKALYALGENPEALALEEADQAALKGLSEDVKATLRDACREHYEVALNLNNLALATEKIELAQRAGLPAKDAEGWREEMWARVRKTVREHFASAEKPEDKRTYPYDYSLNALAALKSDVCARTIEEELDRILKGNAEAPPRLEYENAALRLAIGALGWVGDEQTVPKLMPLVEKQFKEKPLDERLRGDALMAVCRIAPKDRHIYERLYQLIRVEGNNLNTSNFFSMARTDWQIYTARVGIDNAGSAAPTSAAGWFEQGNKYMLGEMPDRAIECFTKVLELNPRNANAYGSRGNARQDEGDLDGAIADFTKALELNPRFAGVYSNRGVARHEKGDLDGAIADFTKALELDPREVAAYSNRGRARHEKGDLDGALADINKALELNPRYAIAYSIRGAARREKGDLDGAIADFTKALELNPRNANAYSNRGHARHKKGDLDGALADINKALELNPRYAEAYSIRGAARHEKGDLDGAIADFTKALELNPRTWRAWLNKGLILIELGKEAEAKACFEKLLEINPTQRVQLDQYIAQARQRRLTQLGEILEGQELDKAEDFQARAQCRFSAKRFLDAAGDFESALKLDPTLAGKGLHFFVASAREQGRDFAGALAAFQNAVKAQPDEAVVQNNLAWFLLACTDEKIRNPAQALPYAEKAKELTGSKNPVYLDTLALAYSKNDRIDEAIETQKKAIGLLPVNMPPQQRKKYEDRLRQYEDEQKKQDK